MDTTALDDIVGELHAKLRHEQQRMTYHAQRADALKTAIRELESLGPEGKSAQSVSSDADASVFQQQEIDGLSTKELVVFVLKREPRSDGWTAGDLAEHMLTLGWGKDVKNPEEAVRTSLVRLEQDGQSQVRRVSRGHYAIEDPLDLKIVNDV